MCYMCTLNLNEFSHSKRNLNEFKSVGTHNLSFFFKNRTNGEKKENFCAGKTEQPPTPTSVHDSGPHLDPTGRRHIRRAFSIHVGAPTPQRPRDPTPTSVTEPANAVPTRVPSPLPEPRIPRAAAIRGPLAARPHEFAEPSPSTRRRFNRRSPQRRLPHQRRFVAARPPPPAPNPSFLLSSPWICVCVSRDVTPLSFPPVFYSLFFCFQFNYAVSDLKLASGVRSILRFRGCDFVYVRARCSSK